MVFLTTTSRLSLRSLALVLTYLTVPLALQFYTAGFNEEPSKAARSAPRALVSGQKLSDVLSPGEARTYEVRLSPGQHARVILDKRDLQLKLSLLRDDQLHEELICRRFGVLQLSFSTDAGATYHIKIQSIESEPGQRQYDLQLAQIEAVTTTTRQQDRAAQIRAEADQLREQPEESAQRAALTKYNEAVILYESVPDKAQAVETLCRLGEVYFALSEYQASLEKYKQALTISESTANESGILAALQGIGYANVYLGRNDMARQYAQKILDMLPPVEPSHRPVADRRAEAQAINTMGEVEYSVGDLRKSIEMFEHAFSIDAEVGDRGGQALTMLNMGYSYSDLGDARKASDYFDKALTAFTVVADGRGRALAETALGGIHSSLGDEQIALDFHKEAANYFSLIGNRQGQAAALNGVARAYQNLNDYEAALDFYDRALQLYETIGNRDFTALNQFLVGRVLFQQGEIQRALDYYEKTLKLTRQVGDRVIEAHALKGIGTVLFARGDAAQALMQFNAALNIYRTLGNRRSEAYVLNDIGHIQTSAGDLPQALANLQQALLLMRETGDKHGEALTLFNTAKAERARDNLITALSVIQDSINIGESLRNRVNNAQLRTSYFASVHEQYELLIDVLMTLHARFPDRGYAIAALVASEKARARSLLDSIMQEKIEPQASSAANSTWAQEQEALRALDEKGEYRTRLLAGKHTQEDVDLVSREISTLTIEYQFLRSKLRAESPRQSELVQPDNLRAEDLQKLFKNDDSVMLEFALGDEASYLWAITANDISSYKLPGRKAIEDSAWRLYYSILPPQLRLAESPTGQSKKLSAADDSAMTQSQGLSNLLLTSVADRLHHKRILIVADGLLHLVPFETLPPPAPTGAATTEELLVDKHEIVMLPSALTLAAIRAEHRSDLGDKRTVYVLADPVFEKDDPRVLAKHSEEQMPNQPENVSTYLSSALRDVNGSSREVSRLPATLMEANAIISLVPSRDRILTTGFAANKESFLHSEIHKYQILHLATHGLLDTEHPDLSGMLLSLVDEQGKSVDGFVRLHDIYNLDLSADLVVLSACRTGLGKEVRGEGVVGLSSGFMYAGAKTVVASLWKVDDAATAEFMSYFYKGMLKDGLTPAAALRNAKLEMRKQSRWKQPFFWAGFVLQGEYKDPVVQSSSGILYLLLGGLTVLFFSLAAYSYLRYTKRRLMGGR